MMGFPEGRKSNPTAGCEEEGSLSRGNNTAPVKGNGEGMVATSIPVKCMGHLLWLHKAEEKDTNQTKP